MTSSGRSPIGSPPSVSYRLPIVTYPLAALVSEIFDLKVADTQTDKQTDEQTEFHVD